MRPVAEPATAMVAIAAARTEADAKPVMSAKKYGDENTCAELKAAPYGKPREDARDAVDDYHDVIAGEHDDVREPHRAERRRQLSPSPRLSPAVMPPARPDCGSANARCNPSRYVRFSHIADALIVLPSFFPHSRNFRE